MALKILQTLEIIEVLENFIDRKRPPVELRQNLDLGYRIEGQSVFLCEIRPLWNKPSEKVEYDFAKAVYVQTKDEWTIYWKRANLKWHTYAPQPKVKTINEFVASVEHDEHHCFWG